MTTPRRALPCCSRPLVSSGSDRLASLSLPEETRSEEHTSELQSHLNLVCRLLLEKKKNKDAPADARGSLERTRCLHDWPSLGTHPGRHARLSRPSPCPLHAAFLSTDQHSHATLSA